MYRHSHWSSQSNQQSSGADAAAGSNKTKSMTGGGGSRAPLHDVNANTLDTTTSTKINRTTTATSQQQPLKTNTKSTTNKVETSLVLDARNAMSKQKSSSNSSNNKPPMNNNNNNREWNFRNKQQQIKEAVTLSYSRNNSLTASSSDEGSTISKKEDEIIQSNLSDVLNETTEQLSKVVRDDKEDTASVISEISDHTNDSEENNIRLDPDTPARAVLRESMETDQAVVTDKITVVTTAAASSSTQTGRSSVRDREEIPRGNAVLDQSEGSLLHRSDKSIHTKVSRSGHQTIHSDLTSSWSKKTFIWNDVTNTYNKFKETRSPNQSKLSSIIEDAQFTALYFCGIDTFGDEEAKVKYEESFKGLNKEERKKEVDDTFLGSVISCGPLSCAPSRCDVLCGTENDRPYHMNPP